MKYVFTVGLCLLINVTLFAQNNQINWSQNRALHDGSVTNGIKLSGKGLYFNLIEFGSVLVEHQEFIGRTSNIGSFATSPQERYSAYATNVASLGAAAGIAREAKGIAYAATIVNYSNATWPQVIDEIASSSNDVRQRLIVNSSSGITIDSEDPANSLIFGTYDRASNTIDDIAWRNPYFLQVVSAGNEGKSVNEKPNTLPLTWEYDKLPGGAQTAKNTVVVGNVYDMALDAQNQILYAFVAATSSAGPTDDMRIKPELCAPGNQLVVANRESIVSDLYYKAYRTNASGTSLAAPIVTGTALLLQELYYTRNKQYMRAATVKGLLMHTANKISVYANGGNSETVNWGISTTEGPDPFCGYGLINATAAAQAILTRGRGMNSIIDEKMLRQGRSDVVDISTKAGQPVTVSISWTDPARHDLNAPFAVLENSKDPTLVNNLGVVVVERSKSSPAVTRLFYPYSFTRQNQRVLTVNDRPNQVDTYEKIRFVPKPDHTYSISISSENIVLWRGQQPYTLIVTGLGQDGQQVNPTCAVTKVIKEPIRFGANEEATNQITIGAEVAPDAGLVEFNAPNLVLTDGTAIQNAEAVMIGQACLRSGLRQAATQPTDSTQLRASLTTDVINDTTLQAYPNPLTEQCTLRSKEEIKTVSVYNMNGNLLLQQKGANSFEVQVNTTSLPPGLYVVVVENALGQKKTKRITKF